MIHGEVQQLLAAGAALEDLAPEEWREYEAHRRSCGVCGRLEVDLDRVLADLALIVPERMPPPDLFDGIRRAISSGDAGASGGSAPLGAVASADEPAPAAEHRPAPAPTPLSPTPIAPRLESRRMDRRPVFAALGLAAAISVVAVGLGVQSMALRTELDTANSELIALRSDVADQSAVMAAAFDPQHVTVSMEPDAIAAGATAYVVYVPGTDEAWLVAHGLPATPADHGYQLWFADAAGVHGLGTYSFSGEGTFVAPFAVDLASSKAAMVTLEPVGGAVGDPGPQVVFGEL
jgi:hypothetical protein